MPSHEGLLPLLAPLVLQIEGAEDASRKQEAYLKSLAPAKQLAPQEGTAGEQVPVAGAASAGGLSMRKRQG